jgi:hypothetical protein
MDLVRRKLTFGSVPMAALRASPWNLNQDNDGGRVRARFDGHAGQCVRAALMSAVRDRVIAIDPSAGLRLPARRRAEHAMEIPTPVQIRALIEHSPKHAGIPGCLRLRQPLPRRGLGVNLEDVDFLASRVYVRRQVQRRRGGPAELRQPKYGSERRIYLPNRLVEMLARTAVMLTRSR